jgi:hypothetical protein
MISIRNGIRGILSTLRSPATISRFLRAVTGRPSFVFSDQIPFTLSGTKLRMSSRRGAQYDTVVDVLRNLEPCRFVLGLKSTADLLGSFERELAHIGNRSLHRTRTR